MLNTKSSVFAICLCMFMGHGVELRCGFCNFNSQALIHAAEKGKVDCARLLIDAGADKDYKNNVRS